MRVQPDVFPDDAAAVALAATIMQALVRLPVQQRLRAQAAGAAKLPSDRLATLQFQSQLPRFWLGIKRLLCLNHSTRFGYQFVRS